MRRSGGKNSKKIRFCVVAAENSQMEITLVCPGLVGRKNLNKKKDFSTLGILDRADLHRADRGNPSYFEKVFHLWLSHRNLGKGRRGVFCR